MAAQEQHEQLQAQRLRQVAWYRATQSPSAYSSAADCPSPDVLLAFRTGGLEAEVQAQTEVHLSECAACVDLLLVPDVPAHPISEANMQRILVSSGIRRLGSYGLPEWLPSWLSRVLEPLIGGLTQGGWPRLVAPSLVMAVALLLVMKSALGPRGIVDEPGSAPDYALSLSGQLKEVRGASEPLEGMPKFGPDSELVLKLTPAQAGPQGFTPGMGSGLYAQTSAGSWQKLPVALDQLLDPQTGLLELRVPVKNLMATTALNSLPQTPEGVGVTLRVLVMPAGQEVPETIQIQETPGSSTKEVSFRYLLNP